MTFALQMSEDYSWDEYKKRLPWSLPRNPSEIWGEPGQVEGAVLAHNRVVNDLSSDHPVVMFVDQASLVTEAPGAFFNDLCHLTTAGSFRFVVKLVDVLICELEDRGKCRD